MSALTVGQLMEQLKAANPDLPVVVDCENRCDPHPIEAVTVNVGSETEDQRFIAHVRLFSNSREDFRPREWKPSADEVDGEWADALIAPHGGA